MKKEPLPKEEPIPELGNRTWSELEVVKDERNALLFKDQIRRMGADGKLEAIPVRIRVPRTPEFAQARSEARQMFQEKKLDPDRDGDILDGLEAMCILARAMRTAEPPHAQFAEYDELGDGYDESSLLELSERLALYKHLIDPRPTNLTPEQQFEKVVAVAKRGHLGPLLDIAGPAQPSFLVFMAELALSSPTIVAWRQSLESSTPEHLPLPNSATSSEAPSVGGPS